MEVKYKEFRIGDLFEQERGKEKSPNRVPDGDIPMINETSSNNGFTKFCTPTQVFRGNCITVSINYATTVFYQDRDFAASVNIAILRNDSFNKYAYLYVITLLRLMHVKYNYSNKISKDKLNDEIILLPVTESGEIDFSYMENYIAELEAERISELEAERISELEAYLAVTGLDDYELTEEDKEVLSL